MPTPVYIKGLAMQTFTIRDLRDRTADIVRDAEAGKLSVITKHGQPVFVAVPFDENLLKSGISAALAVRLFDEDSISLGKAARLAGMSLVDFIDHLGHLRIPVARPQPGELERELAAFG
jgi:prevent-host-death family protein